MKNLSFKKIFVVGVLLFTMLLLPVLTETLPAANVETDAKTYEELQDELKIAQATLKAKETERKEAQKRLAQAKTEMQNTLDTITRLEMEYNILEDEKTYLENEHELTQILLAAYEERQQYYQTLMDEQHAEMEEMLSLYATVLRYKYENGDTSTLEILFNSENFEQFLSRLQYFDNIIEYNDTIVEAISKIETELAGLQDQYNSALENLSYYTELLEQQKTDIQDRQLQMDNLKKEYEEKYAKLENQEAEARRQEKELKADEELLKQAVNDAQNAILNYQNSVSEFSWPLKSGVWYYVSSYFGWRNDPLGRGWKNHSGLDIAAGGGNDILSVADGVVTTSKWHSSYGNYVVVYHGDGVSTLYAHMSKRIAKVGDQVKRGETIGLVGTTGDSTGNHLHFSVIVNGKYLNPDNYLPDGYYVKKYYPADK